MRRDEEATQITSGGPGDPLTTLFRFHRKIRGALVLLAELASAEQLGVAERTRAEGLLHFFRGPLMWHDLDEEASLLRRLRQKIESATEREVLRCVTEDHESMESTIERLLPELEKICVSDDVASLGPLADLRRRLAAVLEPHLSMEERELFPIARRLLNSVELAEMKAEMTRRDEMRRRGKSAAVEIEIDDADHEHAAH